MSENKCTNHYSDGSKIFPNRDCCAPMTSDPTNPERETETPETDAAIAEAKHCYERLYPHMKSRPVHHYRMAKLELSRDSARAEAEQLRERCARLEETAAAMVLWYDCDDGTVSMEASIEALRAALNQPKP